MAASAAGAASEHDKADDVVAGNYCRNEDENDEDDGQCFSIVKGGGYCEGKVCLCGVGGLG